MNNSTGQIPLLLCRVATEWCALPLEYVIETMRPLPIEPFASAPAFVAGLAIIRGTPMPVVDMASLIGAQVGERQRFVTVKAGERKVALWVDEVRGVAHFSPQSFQQLPPLLGLSHGQVIAALGTLDSSLLLVLNHAGLVPEALWSELGQ